MPLPPAPSSPALISRGLLLCLGLSLALHAEVQVVKQAPVPNRVLPATLVLSPNWVGQIPPTGSVNAPTELKSLYSGQKIALAIPGLGLDRENLLRQVRVTLRFTSPTKGVIEERDLKPVAVRAIKAEGADMSLLVLEAGGINPSDRTRLAESMATVSFAIFQPDWVAPPAAQAEDIQISVTLSGTGAPEQPPARSLRLRPTADWLNEPVMSMEDYGKTLNRYHEDLPPGRLLAMLNSMVVAGQAGNPAVATFFALAYQQNEADRRAALELFPSLDPKLQMALLFVFRLGGQDTGQLSPHAPAEVVASVQTVQPLKDPRTSLHFTSPVKPQAVQEIGATMDQCWCGWMATGDQSYLRAMVGLLAYAPDFPAYAAWLKARGGLPGFNDSVARGITYQIAGWSLSSFQFHDPHATDWLLYWRNDPTFPAELRREIAAMPANPAFKRR
jgi:hypothetical protein